jgi:hypothetical protein
MKDQNRSTLATAALLWIVGISILALLALIGR